LSVQGGVEGCVSSLRAAVAGWVKIQNVYSVTT
jgi:hypothetical protein